MKARRALFTLIAACLFFATSFGTQADATGRKARLVGVVLPSDARPGERVSGSIVLYPNALTGVPGLQVEKTHIEIDDNAPRKAVLQGIVTDGGTERRSADANFIIDIPADAKSVHLAMLRDEQNIGAVEIPIEPQTHPPLQCESSEWVFGTEQDGSKSEYRTPGTYCYAGIAVIAGTFSGDALLTRVEVGGHPARIVAESPRYCYWLLPPNAGPGRIQVTLHEGSHLVAFHTIVPRLDLMQMLEDNPGVAQAPSTASNAAASDNPAPSLPLGIGVGIGGSSFGGGGENQGGVRLRGLRER